MSEKCVKNNDAAFTISVGYFGSDFSCMVFMWFSRAWLGSHLI